MSSNGILRVERSLVLLLTVVAPCLACAQQIPKAVRHYEVGLTLEEEKHYSAAAQEFKKTIEINPEFTDAYYRLGLSCFKEGDPVEAIRYLMQLNQLEPNNIDAVIAVGQIYSGLGHLNAARALYFRELQRRGQLWHALRAIEDAGNGLQTHAEGRANRAQVEYCLGILEIDGAHYQSAVAHLKKTISINSTFAGPFYYLGQAYQHLGELGEAAHALNRCVSIDPNYQPAIHLLKEIKHIRSSEGGPVWPVRGARQHHN